MSNINFYRYPNARSEADSWKSCQFTSDTDLSAYTIQPLVTINGQPFLRQHHSTYLTGKEPFRFRLRFRQRCPSDSVCPPIPRRPH